MNENVKPQKTIEELNLITDRVVDALFAVHRTLGPGFKEEIYEASLLKEFELVGMKCESQVAYPVFYKGHDLGKICRIDLLVEDEIILELKSVDALLPIHQAQLLSYLKLTGKRIGYLANFKVSLMKDGIKRMRLDSGSKFHTEPLRTGIVLRGPVRNRTMNSMDWCRDVA